MHTCSCPFSSSSSIGYGNVCAMKHGAKPIHLKGEKQNRHQLFVQNRGDGKKFIQFTYLISLLALFCEEETMKGCSFHLVLPHILRSVHQVFLGVNCEFIYGELHGTFSILLGLNFEQCSFHSFGHTFCFLSNVY